MNLATLLATAQRIHAARPEVRFLVACFRPAHRDAVAAALQGSGLPITAVVGRTAEVIELAHACVAVSGSVSLELLYRGKPSVVVYRVGRWHLKLARRLMTTPFISLVNLLAGKEIYPEFLSARCEAERIARHVLRWLNDVQAYEAVCAELRALRRRVAETGACDRAAEQVLTALADRHMVPEIPPRRLSA